MSSRNLGSSGEVYAAASTLLHSQRDREDRDRDELGTKMETRPVSGPDYR